MSKRLKQMIEVIAVQMYVRPWRWERRLVPVDNVVPGENEVFLIETPPREPVAPAVSPTTGKVLTFMRFLPKFGRVPGGQIHAIKIKEG